MVGRRPRHSKRDYLQAVNAQAGPATPHDVADDLGLSFDGARRRLQSIVDDQFLKSKQVGASETVYWLTDSGRRKLRDSIDTIEENDKQSHRKIVAQTLGIFLIIAVVGILAHFYLPYSPIHRTIAGTSSVVSLLLTLYLFQTQSID